MMATFPGYAWRGAIIALTFVTGCSSSMTINYDYDAQAEFDRFRTYAWMKNATGTRDGVKQHIPTGGSWTSEFALRRTSTSPARDSKFPPTTPISS